MRREQFSLEMTNTDWPDEDGEPRLPTLVVTYDGDPSTLRDRLLTAEGDVVGAEGTDLAFRLHGSLDDADASGVVAVTDRVTGDYLFEFNVEADDLLEFITAARRYGERTDDASRYRISVTTDDGELIAHEKRILLVYSDEGELLRGRSLIPSGVEI